MKRISPGTVTVGVFAILFGLVAACVVRHYLDGPAVRSPARQTAAVVTAKVNLPKYSRIREQGLEVTQVPIKELPEGAVQNISRALFRLVKGTIMAGQPILEEKLYGVGEVPLLSDQLPPGYRAVTLQVDANSALNGMIQPESHVDVTLTVKGERVRESLEATVASGAGEPAPPVRISAASGNVPTLAPPQDMPHPAAEPRLDRQPRGQVIYVQVEAEGAGGEKN